MDTKVKPVEILPLVKYYMEELELARLFDQFVPHNNGAEIAPAQVLSLMVMNIMVSAKPLYRVEDWLHDYLDGVTEERFEAAKYNDDRLGRSLDLLFAADRASFMTELSANAIRVHQLETQEIHNDSTSITFLGAYDEEDPKAVTIVHGYNNVAPVFLETPRRIEAMMFLYFIALMVVSLIERRIRLEMRERNIASLPMRPAGMQTKKPTWRTIVDTFHGVHLGTIERSGKTIHTALKGFNALRQQILELLKVPLTIYTRLRDGWWEFALE